MSLFNNNVMGYGSVARKYGEYAAYYPHHYDSFGGNPTSPGPVGVDATLGTSSINATSQVSQSEVAAAAAAGWPATQDLHHVQHSMSSYYPHHPAFLPTHHGPTARDFREAAAAQVNSLSLYSYISTFFIVLKYLQMLGKYYVQHNFFFLAFSRIPLRFSFYRADHDISSPVWMSSGISFFSRSILDMYYIR